MARSVNQVRLLGYLGRDPETRFTGGGTIIAEMRMATTERRKRGGDWVDETEWHNLKVFNRLAEVCRDYLKKGAKLYVEGRLHTDRWEKDEQAHFRTEILVEELIILDGAEKERPAELGK